MNAEQTQAARWAVFFDHLNAACAEWARPRPAEDAPDAEWKAWNERYDAADAALLAAHAATAPSETPATHVFVAVDRLAYLEAVEQATRTIMTASDLNDAAGAYLTVRNLLGIGGAS